VFLFLSAPAMMRYLILYRSPPKNQFKIKIKIKIKEYREYGHLTLCRSPLDALIWSADHPSSSISLVGKPHSVRHLTEVALHCSDASIKTFLPRGSDSPYKPHRSRHSTATASPFWETWRRLYLDSLQVVQQRTGVRP